MVSFTVFQTRGGSQLVEVEPSRWDWQEQSGNPETVNLTFVDHVDEWRNLFTPFKHSIAVNVGGRFVGGPIMAQSYDGDKAELKVTVRGFGALFDKVPILPVSALTADLTPNGAPDASFDTHVTGGDLGTVAKRLVQQALTWPGWTDIPVQFQPDRAGTADYTYAAVDLKRVSAALSDLTGVRGGPDIRFRLVQTDQDHFGWVFETGTLQADQTFTWEPDDTSGLSVDLLPARMGSMSWSSGGRTTDQTIVRGLYDSTLVDAGFPLMHLESSASSSTSQSGTLDDWNVETLRTAFKPWEFWSFKVPVDLSPFPGEYLCGDLAGVSVTAAQLVTLGLAPSLILTPAPDLAPSAGSVSPVRAYTPPGLYTRRIVGLSGSSDSQFITVTCGETYDGGS